METTTNVWRMPRAVAGGPLLSERDLGKGPIACPMRPC